MRRVSFSEGAPATNELAVARFERALSVSFPEDYRAFLLTVNGGRPDPACVRFEFAGDTDVSGRMNSRDDLESLADHLAKIAGAKSRPLGQRTAIIEAITGAATYLGDDPSFDIVTSLAAFIREIGRAHV